MRNVYKESILQVLIDGLGHLDENKNYVKRQKYLFLIELISKTKTTEIKLESCFFFSNYL
jgi:hypothetical protein